ncbi:hypothetical protein Leryth_002705 [Lithospermum erythrorhizon]|nr:hypothetical protein Leryth_002705 [Lithospermum erythrorhizon]
MSPKAIQHQLQPDLCIDIEHIQMTLTASQLRDTNPEFIQKTLRAIELQRWKDILWDVIRKGSSELLGEFLIDLAAGRQKTIQGLNTPIWEGGPPVLHIVTRKRFEIPVVLQLAGLIPENELTIQDETGETTLHVAIQAGNTPLAMVLLDRKPDLAKIRDNFGRLPVQAAAGIHKRELSFHLHQLTKLDNLYQEGEESDVLLKAMSAGWFEMVLYILDGNPELEWHKMEPLLTYLVNEPRAFPSRTPLNMLQSWIYSYIVVHPTEDMTSFIIKEMMRSESINFARKQPHAKVFKVLLKLLQVPFKIWEKLGTYILPVASYWINLGGILYLVPWIPSYFSCSVSAFVQPIKNVRRAKIEHQLTNRTLRYVCREIRNHHLTRKCRKYEIREVNKADYFDNSLVQSVFFLAAQNGIHEMVESILEVFPEAIESRNDKGLSALDLAAMYRHEKVFEIALERGAQIRGEMLFQVADNALQSLLDTGSRVVFRCNAESRCLRKWRN